MAHGGLETASIPRGYFFHELSSQSIKELEVCLLYKANWELCFIYQTRKRQTLLNWIEAQYQYWISAMFYEHIMEPFTWKLSLNDVYCRTVLIPLPYRVENLWNVNIKPGLELTIFVENWQKKQTNKQQQKISQRTYPQTGAEYVLQYTSEDGSLPLIQNTWGNKLLFRKPAILIHKSISQHEPVYE